MIFRSTLFLLILITASRAVTLTPDSSSVTLQPMMSIDKVIDSVRICNTTAAPVTVDSIIIKFLNGDSADFAKGKDCDPKVFSQYIYNGWVYGWTYRSLRYVRDSVFLLQDSSGKQVTISVGTGACTVFQLREITNCPVCGRMPSFPKTTRYSYTFFSSSGNATFLLKVNDVTAVSPSRTQAIVKLQKPHQAAFDARGRKISSGNSARFEMQDGKKRIVVDDK